MTLPSELAMNIRIIKALAENKPCGPLRHFAISSILKRLKKPNVITGKMFWRFLSVYYGANEPLEVPETSSYKDFLISAYL
ncbi:hypothetical protein NEFER03_0010 [Nematocida sp. LUAm3]|nr:hypothetical protein NEFER03_0010 [Nematocida sp. LUAm3]KAI5173492.1 hypothetical protein NEFER02_0008 [Nematocida sp. LUAm2]KAI5176685.1 hypothetical protein NEFER01_0010 [Nematocida sp. LUAm1]